LERLIGIAETPEDMRLPCQRKHPTIEAGKCGMDLVLPGGIQSDALFKLLLGECKLATCHIGSGHDLVGNHKMDGRLPLLRQAKAARKDTAATIHAEPAEIDRHR